MKSNHDDGLPQSRDVEVDDDTTERSADPSLATADRVDDEQLHPETMNPQEPSEDPSFSPQEIEESWEHADERDHANQSANFGSRVSPKKRTTRNRRLFSAFALLAIIIGGMIAVYYTFIPSRSVKINVKTNQPTQTQDAIAKSDKGPEDVTAEAIAEVRRAIANPASAAVSPSALNSVLPRGAQDLTAPMSSSVLPPEQTEKPVDGKHEALTREESRRNRERSIRFVIDADQSPFRKVSLDSHSNNVTTDRGDKALSNTLPVMGLQEGRSSKTSFVADASHKLTSKTSVAPVVLPTFGSILPVRTLGKIYTLRSGSSIRLELTRYVAGEGWSLSKGTVLIGQVRGSERDRAYIAVTGFIDPSRDRFVNLAGETLGDDGGSGLRGQFHKLSSGWSRAFARVGSAAVNVAGAVAGSRISGQPVIITDVGSRSISPFSYEVDSSLLNQARFRGGPGWHGGICHGYDAPSRCERR